jgi:uncharacterized protein involved in exopolysaccharide biosynthesis
MSAEVGGYQSEWAMLPQILTAMRRRLILVAALTMLGGLIALAFALVMVPVYHAEAVVVIVEPDASGSSLSGLSGMLGQLGGLVSMSGLGPANERGEYIAMLKSRRLIDDFVEQKGLLPVLFAKEWDATHNRWRKDRGDKNPSLWDAYKKFDKRVRGIAEDKRNGLITFSIEWSDPKLAAAWANDLVRRADETLRQEAIVRSNENIAYLQQELKKTNVVELQQAIYRLIESQIKSVMLAQGGKEYALKIIDPAVVPEESIRPKPMLMVVFGLIAGFVVSASAAVFLDRIRSANGSASGGRNTAV